jgi:ligand-binding SRPBCC domain-containing protein
MIYTLERKVDLGAPLENCWEFLRNPFNLNRITPPDLHFHIVSDIPGIMYNGLLITYTIRIPGFGRRHWLTEIKHIRDGHSFVDEQRYGPFRFWYHHHELIEKPDCTQSLDNVSYIMPYGPLGIMVHSLYIQKIMKRIFDFREQRLQDIFPLPAR